MSLEEHQQLRERTKKFALRIIRMADLLPYTRSANVMANQVLRSATSVTANYRAAGRSRSKAEFVAKIGVVVEEADETLCWLELLSESNILPAGKLTDLLKEANELVAIFVASRKTARA